MTSTLRPRRIQGDDTTVREIGDETLIYDEHTHRAWCLNQSSACVWHLCDGRNTVREIAALATEKLAAAMSEDLVLLAIAELEENQLLHANRLEALPQDASRRQMLGKIGMAAAALLPVVAAITAPPAMAQGGTVSSDLRKARAKRAPQ